MSAEMKVWVDVDTEDEGWAGFPCPVGISWEGKPWVGNHWDPQPPPSDDGIVRYCLVADGIENIASVNEWLEEDYVLWFDVVAGQVWESRSNGNSYHRMGGY